jgi:uncharacterized protein YoxC
MKNNNIMLSSQEVSPVAQPKKTGGFSYIILLESFVLLVALALSIYFILFEVPSLKQEKESLEKRVKETTNQIDLLNKEKDKLNTNLNELQNAITQLKETNSSVTKSNEELTQTVSRLTDEKTAIEASLTKSNDELTQTVSRLTDEKTAIEEKNIKLKKDSEKLVAALQEMFNVYTKSDDIAIIKFVSILSDKSAQSLLESLPEDYLRRILYQSNLGQAITPEVFDSHTAVAIISNLRKAAMDYSMQGKNLLTFSTEVNPDNTPVTPTMTFTTNTQRIYACFKNEEPLAKLKTVIVKWVNVTTQEIMYWKCFEIDPKKPYNFVFLSYQDKWIPGAYLISIYKNIEDTSPIGYGKFEIK